jgi:hypothetical protein
MRGLAPKVGIKDRGRRNRHSPDIRRSPVLSSYRGVGAKTDVLAEAVDLRKIGVDNIYHLTARHAYRTVTRQKQGASKA